MASVCSATICVRFDTQYPGFLYCESTTRSSRAVVNFIVLASLQATNRLRQIPPKLFPLISSLLPSRLHADQLLCCATDCVDDRQDPFRRTTFSIVTKPWFYETIIESVTHRGALLLTPLLSPLLFQSHFGNDHAFSKPAPTLTPNKDQAKPGKAKIDRLDGGDVGSNLVRVVHELSLWPTEN
jgi:hypothetical protein